MEIKITIEPTTFGKERKTDAVIVQFPDCISINTMRPFKWVPSYKQLSNITKAIIEQDKMNQEALKINNRQEK